MEWDNPRAPGGLLGSFKATWKQHLSLLPFSLSDQLVVDLPTAEHQTINLQIQWNARNVHEQGLIQSGRHFKNFRDLGPLGLPYIPKVEKKKCIYIYMYVYIVNLSILRYHFWPESGEHVRIKSNKLGGLRYLLVTACPAIQVLPCRGLHRFQDPSRRSGAGNGCPTPCLTKGSHLSICSDITDV